VKEAGGRAGGGNVKPGRRKAEREREFIFHIAKTLEQVQNRNAKLGGLPERHLAHQSWPPTRKCVSYEIGRHPITTATYKRHPGLSHHCSS